MLLIFSYGDHSEFWWMIYQRIASKFVVLWRLLREMCIFWNCILKIKTNYIQLTTGSPPNSSFYNANIKHEMCILRNCILKMKNNFIFNSQLVRLEIRRFTTPTQSAETRNVNFQEFHFENKKKLIIFNSKLIFINFALFDK